MFDKYNVYLHIEKSWIKELMVLYLKFLEQNLSSKRTIKEHLVEAKTVFKLMDNHLLISSQLDYEWLNRTFENITITKAKRSIISFLIQNKVIKLPSEEKKYINKFKNMVDCCDEPFQKAITLYYSEKLDARKLQVERNARNPIAFGTIEENIRILVRLINWLKENYPMIKSWIDIQEEHISSFLLTLTPNNRECMRKDLYVFFKVAKRKRCIFTIPMVNYKSRELPRVNYVLSFDEQRKLAHQIVNEGILFPYEALLTLLAYYHALSSRDIGKIKLQDIDIDNKKILLNNRRPAYLMEIELLILQEYLKMRKSFPNSHDKEYLFIRRKRSGIYDDINVNKEFICKCVKNFSGFTPQTLRITCLTAMANLNGPQFLIEAYGISQTHAGRFGKYEDYLLEEELKEEIQMNP